MDSSWLVLAVQSFATIALAILTFIYVRETRALRNQSQQALEDARRERLASILPFLVIRQVVDSPRDSKRIYLSNIGRGPAMKIEFFSEIIRDPNSLPHVYDDKLQSGGCIQHIPILNGEALAPGNGSFDTGALLHTVKHNDETFPLNHALARALMFYEDSIGRGFVSLLFNGEYIQGMLYDSSLSWDKKKNARKEFMIDVNLSVLKEKAETLRESTLRMLWNEKPELRSNGNEK